MVFTIVMDNPSLKNVSASHGPHGHGSHGQVSKALVDHGLVVRYHAPAVHDQIRCSSHILHGPGKAAEFQAKMMAAVPRAMGKVIDQATPEMLDVLKKEMASDKSIEKFKTDIDSDENRAMTIEMLKNAKFNQLVKDAMAESAELKAAWDDAMGKYPELKDALGE